MTPDTPGPFVSPQPAHPPGEPVERTFSDDELVWTADEQATIDGYRAQYPTPDAAIMKVLWLAQLKFGFLPPEVVKLCSDTVGMPYSKAYGVATFYTMYFKEKKGTYVFDVCTCFSCQVTGGYDILHYLEEKLGVVKGGTTEDGMFTVQEAECLGACGSAPMLQVTNGPYVHNLTKEKVDTMLAALRAGQELPFESVTLPQDEAELGGNRRSDAQAVTEYDTPPVSETIR